MCSNDEIQDLIRYKEELELRIFSLSYNKETVKRSLGTINSNDETLQKLARSADQADKVVGQRSFRDKFCQFFEITSPEITPLAVSQIVMQAIKELYPSLIHNSDALSSLAILVAAVIIRKTINAYCQNIV
jgi:hypothetical protein